jgi:outer membrane receptor protein involved in Fe transport
MEPLGSERLPSTKLVSLRAEKRFQLSASRRLAVQFDVYNALNANDATGMSFRSGPTYSQITAILPPRVARFGLSYAF